MENELIVPFNIDKPVVYTALSELMINALNETFFAQCEEVEIYQLDGKWVIRDYGRGLSLSHFNQSGNVEKLFYKDALTPSRINLVEAMAILTIQEVDLVIFSKHGTFTFEILDYKTQEQSGSLKITRAEPFDLDLKGTLIELTGVEEALIWKARATLLQFSKDTAVDHTPWGQIIKNPDNMGAVFVNGVKIAETPHYYYKYNITQVPETLQNGININPTHIPKDLYEGIIKKILRSSQSFVIAEEVLLIHGKDEVEKSYQDISWDDITLHFVKVLNQKGEFVFISKLDYQFHVRYSHLSETQSMKTIYVQDHIMRNLYGLLDYKHTPIFLKKDLLQKKNAKNYTIISYKELDQSEKKVYSNLKTILDLFGGLPKEVKKIRIFELDDYNMENDSENEGKYCLYGRCIYAEKTIILNRLILKSLNEFASVLLHELIHAKYECQDFTKEFEDRLTETMGDLAARYIEDFYYDFD